MVQQTFLGFYTGIRTGYPSRNYKVASRHTCVVWVVGGCEGQITKKKNNEDESEPPEAPVQLRERELALPHCACTTGLATTPRLLLLVRVREERKRR